MRLMVLWNGVAKDLFLAFKDFSSQKSNEKARYVVINIPHVKELRLPQ